MGRRRWSLVADPTGGSSALSVLQDLMGSVPADADARAEVQGLVDDERQLTHPERPARQGSLPPDPRASLDDGRSRGAEPDENDSPCGLRLSSKAFRFPRERFLP